MKSKYSENLPRHGWKTNTLWPNYVRLISPEKLGCEEKMILLSLLAYRGKGRIMISNERLASNSSISLATLKRKIVNLQKMGLIERRRVKNSRTLETIINEGKILDLIETDSPKDYKNIFGDRRPIVEVLQDEEAFLQDVRVH
jgi:DNA-binding MarR family transcriptional regulator